VTFRLGANGHAWASFTYKGQTLLEQSRPREIERAPLVGSWLFTSLGQLW